MKRIIPKKNNIIRHPEDCKRIVSIFEKKGYKVSLSDAQTIWEDFSNNEWEAGWISLYSSDEEVFTQAMKYSKVIT